MNINGIDFSGATRPLDPVDEIFITEGYETKFIDEILVTTAIVNSSHVLSVFVTLLDLFEPTVNILLATRHGVEEDAEILEHFQFCRDDIDKMLLISSIYNHEELFLCDGYTELAIFDSKRELMLTDTKEIWVTCFDQTPASLLEVLEVLEKEGVKYNRHLQLFSHLEHIHYSNDNFEKEISTLVEELNCDLLTDGISSNHTDGWFDNDGPESFV